MRPSFDDLFIDIAATVSKRSTCTRKRVGSVLARDNRIIGIGYNGSLPGQPHCNDGKHYCLIGPDGGCIRTQHAEINLICFLAKNGISTNETTFYITLSPCYTCAKSIVMAGIKRVVYLEEYRKTDGVELLEQCGVEVEKYERREDRY